MQTLHFRLKNTKTVLLKTGNDGPLFAEISQTNFVSKLNKYISFMKLYRKTLRIRAQEYLKIILCTWLQIQLEY